MIARFKAGFGRSTVAKALVAALVGTAAVFGISTPAQASNCPTPQTVGGWALPKGAYICQLGYSTVMYDGRIHVFLVGTDWTIYHTWQTARSAPFVNHWTSLGGKGISEVKAYESTYLSRKILEVNVQGTDGNWWCKDYNYRVVGGWWPSQTGWRRCNF
ncbi:hypothetical protein [Krasilnikovia sp. M28-CT-15]|uniref:hypothetical protein n=1 Tax=Krasilnikovia sp. M28-CT-15 TaxID=3373540 RepID=UPI003876BD40